MEWMSHRKQKETKQQPDTAGQDNILGCCLVSLSFLCNIHSIHSVLGSSRRQDVWREQELSCLVCLFFGAEFYLPQLCTSSSFSLAAKVCPLLTFSQASLSYRVSSWTSHLWQTIFGFFYPSPLVTVTNQQILFLLSAFLGPPRVGTSYMEVP